MNNNLKAAKAAKNDEFYTQYEDIKKEVDHYKDQLENKVIYMNCDSEESNFWKYFVDNFIDLKLKKIIATSFSADRKTYKVEYDGIEVIKTELKQNGDFRSPECIDILKNSDIVITNPPFSLFRDYMELMVNYNKLFLVIGSQNAITYKGIFPLLKDNQMWLGYNSGGFKFKVPDSYNIGNTIINEKGEKYSKLGNITWYTNLNTTKRIEKIILYKNYIETDFAKYDNYDAINIDKVADIPADYFGVMGVPITFVDKYNPEQFEILGCNRGVDQDTNGIYGKSSYINEKETFKRLFIKRKDQNNEN